MVSQPNSAEPLPIAVSVKPHLISAAAIGFGVFLIAVVFIANRGEAERWWPFLYHMPYGDKIGHIGLFGTLCFLCNLAFPSRHFGRRPFLITLTTLVLLAVITLEEISQLYIPTRNFDLLDWLADLVAITAGQTAACLYPRIFRRKVATEKTTS